jgi:hypothetical protein
LSNVYSPNYALPLPTHAFAAMWRYSRVKKKAGWTVKASGNGSGINRDGSTDLWGTNADPLLDVYPSGLDGQAAWICLEGPRTVKVPLTAAPTVDPVLQLLPIRGEKVTQADGSEGELLGYVFDATAGAGWAVIGYRVGPWTTTGTITCASTLATFAPSATPRLFVRQEVIWKSSATVNTGSVYYICADETSEAAQIFSALAQHVNCTASVAPGGSNVAGGNNFPALGIVVRGTAAVAGGAAAVHTAFLTATSNLGAAQITGVNAVPATGVTPDGTTWVFVSNTGTPGTGYLFGFFRLDDSEPGDIDPYVYQTFCTTAVGSFSRTSNLAGGATNYSFSAMTNASSVTWTGYCARGLGGSKDDATYFIASAEWGGGGASLAEVSNAADTMRVANYPTGVTSPLALENPKLYCNRTGFSMKKGRIRWLAYAPTGAALDHDTAKNWLWIAGHTGTTAPAVAIGPYDGTTTPSPT